MAPSTTAAVVTSRLPRLVPVDDTWLVALRGTLRRLASEPVQLLIGQGTAGSEFVRHAANRLQIPFDNLVAASDGPPDDGSPPERDRIAVETVNTVFVLTLRTDGNLHQLLRRRLQQGGGPVVLVDIPNLQADVPRIELLDLGATTWTPSAEQCRPFDQSRQSDECGCLVADSASPEILEIAPWPNTEHWDFLTHTTRACPGPWPGQSFGVYADSLLESLPEADHSPLGALRRILRQRRLIASNRTIRGGYPVVSLTACPLERLPALHRFRPHRGRWDFEPFGLCLRKDWLSRRGARSVSYSDEAHWTTLPEQDRPYFQIRVGATGIDWSVESEWRHVGDLDLTDVTPRDVLIFVPDSTAARSIAALTNWPITLWPR